MRGKNEGSLTVEAALVYPIFLIVFITIINFLNIFHTHSIVQHGINNTAKKIAEYGYAVKLLDPDFSTFNLRSETNEKTKKVESTIIDFSNSTKSAMTTISNGIKLDNIVNIIDVTEKFAASTNELCSEINSIDSENILNYLVFSLADGTSDFVLESMTKKYLEDMKLNMTNVKNMDFSKSRIFNSSSNYDITIVVTYKYKNPFIFKLFDDIDMVQTVTVRPWIGGTKSGLR